MQVWWLAALLAVLLAGCGKAEMENRGWCLPLEDETVLTTTDGEEFAATEGEAVENEYGNYLITDTNGAQRLVDGKGNLLAQASAGAALCQPAKEWAMVQRADGLWVPQKLGGDPLEEYACSSALAREDGGLMLSMPDATVWLSETGAEQGRWNPGTVWEADGLSGWYELDDGQTICLIDPQGQVRWQDVERMVGQGRALVRAADGWQVVQAETGAVLYEGPQRWWLYLDELQLEWGADGALKVRTGEPSGVQVGWVNSWPYEGQVRYYLASATPAGNLLWGSTGRLLLTDPVGQWLEPAEPGKILRFDGEGIAMLDEQGAVLWQKDGYQEASLVSGDGFVAIRAGYDKDGAWRNDLLSLDGAVLLQELDEVYQIAPDGASVRRGNTAGVIDWKGRWAVKYELDTASSAG